jgi:hypothetical protein
MRALRFSPGEGIAAAVAPGARTSIAPVQSGAALQHAQAFVFTALILIKSGLGVVIFDIVESECSGIASA